MLNSINGSFRRLSTDDPFYDRYSNFEIDKKIGEGQFSTVYRARCLVNGQMVALKKIQIFEIMDTKARMDCIKEINLLQRVKHPNIISYLGSFIEDNILYIVLDLADAGDMSTMLKYFKDRGRLLPEKTIWKYFSQVCYALEHMHSRRVMHRDIKPANIFITAEGTVKVGDLGLGRYLSSKTKAAYSLVGTPYYMSPERLKEDGYDFKCDIWSLGCVLYEMAALQSPFSFEQKNLHKLCMNIGRGNHPPIPGEMYSQELVDLVEFCMNIDPQKRPDIVQVIQNVERISASLKEK